MIILTKFLIAAQLSEAYFLFNYFVSNSMKHYHSSKDLKTLPEVYESEDETDGISTKSNEKLPPDAF